jgi:hypothetical protein
MSGARSTRSTTIAAATRSTSPTLIFRPPMPPCRSG